MPPEFIIITLVGAAIILMWDVSRHTYCPQCPHCQRIKRDQNLERRKRGHENYHFYAPGSADDCNDPNCPGIK